MMMKKKILIDLDIVTVGIWDKKSEISRIARSFIKRVESGEFEVVTPHILLDLVSRWDNKLLRDDIKKFYLENTNRFVERVDVINKIGEIFEEVFTELENKDIKDEDVFLVLTTSSENLDYLVTFNRKHLKNKEKVIDKVLSKYKMRKIRIALPNEI